VLKRAQAARLLTVDRDASGTRLLLLGRDEAGIGSAEGPGLRVADASVAERHAIIRYARGRYYVVDLKSAGGTFVNGRRIRRKQTLKHGDILRFAGAAPYRFIDPDALKRRRERRMLRVGVVVAVLVALGLADHFGKWNVLSRATVAQIVAWAESHVSSKRVDAPSTIAASAPAPAASVARATNTPAPPVSAAAVAVTAPPPPPKMPSSSPTTSVSASSSMTWLERINFFRSGAGLEPIHENPELSAAAAAHARYLLLNFVEDIRSAKPMSADAYEESPVKSGYSAKGATAAPDLQLAWGCSSFEPGQQIDHWIEGPFHRLAMLDPFLTEAGFGEASRDGCWVATLRLPPPPEEVKPYARAVEFPPAGAAIALDWIGLESPDPLASCPGFERPVGLPITLQIGRLADTNLTAHSLMEDGKPIEHCAFDAPSYRNPNATAQEYGRWNLRNATAVVIVPRSPLRPGSHYTVSITANNRTYAWSFTVVENQATTFAPVAKFPTPVPEESLTEPAKTASPRPRRTARPSHRATPAAAASVIAPENPAVTTPASPPITNEVSGTSSSGSNWLTTLNGYRTRLEVPPVAEDPALSRGCLAHVKYLMTNYEEMMAHGGQLAAAFHQEDESKPGYSPEGLKAARASDVIYQPRNGMTNGQLMAQAVQWWISGPFHRAQLVNPELTQVGFGQVCARVGCVSALDSVSDAPLAPATGRLLAEPIKVPPDGATVKTPGFGGEWPSPVASCPGYSTSSPAITLQLGMWVPAKIGAASLTQTTGAAAGTKVATCAYDSEGYTNPDAGAQRAGRRVLTSYGEVVMMVRDPLAAGETYRVAMTVSGKPYSWSFTAAP
jgi:uncharacterized protein YkwD